MKKYLGPFWSWNRPFWKGFMEGLALQPLWWWVARTWRNRRR